MNKTSKFILIWTLMGLILYSCGHKMSPAHMSGQIASSYDSAAVDYIYVEAIKQKLLGNAGDAIKLLEQCIKVNSNNDAAYFQIAQILMSTGDVNNGKKYGLKAYEINKENYWYSIMLASTYYQQKNLDSAIIFYEKAVKGFPEKEELQMNLGNLYAENKKYDKASQIFENLDKKYGINESSTASAVKILMATGKFGEAEEKTKLLIEKYPDEILFKGLLAEIYSSKGETDKAMDVYNNLMTNDPDNTQTQLSLSDFLIKQKDYNGLMILIRKIVLNNNMQKEEKISLFSKLIETPELLVKNGNELQTSCIIMETMYKNDDIVLMLRPEVMIGRKMLKEAADRLEEIIISNPDNYYAWEKLLFIYLEEKDYKNLEEKGELCSTKFNRSFTAKVLYANAAIENSKYEIALEELRKAEILAGDDADMLLQVFSLRAEIYYRMKDYDNTFKTFDEALKHNSEDLTILNNYAYYLAEQNTRLKDAEIMAKKVIEKDKENPTFLDTYGWVLYKRGKYNEAAKIMESIINSGKITDAEYYEHYGYILRKKKDCISAVNNWNIALKIDSSKTNLLKEIQDCQKGH
jgi:tetratricopeptide (TPR) repeat protein